MMNDIGKRMVKGVSIGAGTGFVAGGIYGGIRAQQEINKLPVDSVLLRPFDKPTYEDKLFTGPSGHSKTATFPIKNPDGTFKMEHVPAKTFSDHGRAVVSEVVHDINEPCDVRSYVTFNQVGKVMVPQTHTTVEYKTTGHWSEPTVNFETGVSRLGNILGFATLGAFVGGIGGAIVVSVLNRIEGASN